MKVSLQCDPVFILKCTPGKTGRKKKEKSKELVLIFTYFLLDILTTVDIAYLQLEISYFHINTFYEKRL